MLRMLTAARKGSQGDLYGEEAVASEDNEATKQHLKTVADLFKPELSESKRDTGAESSSQAARNVAANAKTLGSLRDLPAWLTAATTATAPGPLSRHGKKRVKKHALAGRSISNPDLGPMLQARGQKEAAKSRAAAERRHHRAHPSAMLLGVPDLGMAPPVTPHTRIPRRLASTISHHAAWAERTELRRRKKSLAGGGGKPNKRTKSQFNFGVRTPSLPRNMGSRKRSSRKSSLQIGVSAPSPQDADATRARFAQSGLGPLESIEQAPEPARKSFVAEEAAKGEKRSKDE
jgi:hypothetical protein